MATCACSTRFWRGLGAQLNLPAMTDTDPIEGWWKGRRRLLG